LTHNGLQSVTYTVLIADDNRDTVETLSALLRMEGHHVIEAHCGAEALDQGQQWQPRVLVLDIGMPRLDGYEVARQVRREPWGHQAILIAHSGWCRSEDRQRAVAAGFNYHVTKPIDPDALLELFPSKNPAQKECSIQHASLCIKSP
jgi:CheY-like chemotaxis protein